MTEYNTKIFKEDKVSRWTGRWTEGRVHVDGGTDRRTHTQMDQWTDTQTNEWPINRRGTFVNEMPVTVLSTTFITSSWQS